jgi:hypothetical protein
MASSAVIVCGGTPSESDLAVINEFRVVLNKPTREESRVALIEMMAAHGDTEAAGWLAARREQEKRS